MRGNYHNLYIFLSTPPRGERRMHCRRSTRGLRFLSTPPRGERLSCRRTHSARLRHFYPRPRVGSDTTPGIEWNMGKISIHAPAWGATTAKSHPVASNWYFYPRPRVGSDSGPARQAPSLANFYPRPRVGSDSKHGKKMPCLHLFVVQSEKTPEQFPKITRPFSEIRFPLHKIKQKLMYSAVRTSRQNNGRSRFAL